MLLSAADSGSEDGKCSYAGVMVMTKEEMKKEIRAQKVGTYPSFNCRCTNANQTAIARDPPDFVTNDYFCDTGSTHHFQLNHLYADDPLWDGVGCEKGDSSTNHSCTFQSD